jgi:hypothetical protein
MIKELKNINILSAESKIDIFFIKVKNYSYYHQFLSRVC